MIFSFSLMCRVHAHAHARARAHSVTVLLVFSSSLLDEAAALLHLQSGLSRHHLPGEHPPPAGTQSQRRAERRGGLNRAGPGAKQASVRPSVRGEITL